jgi:hypothetical protein
MNAQIPMTPALDIALREIMENLPWEQRMKVVLNRAKLIVIDGEVWFVDMRMKEGK